MSILDPKFKYTPADKTDVQATWRRFGWTPQASHKLNLPTYKQKRF